MDSNCHLFFETLGTRLKINILLKLKENPRNVTKLSKQLGQERSKVSHALKSLLECGFVNVKRSSRERVYSLNRKTIMPLLDLVEKHVKKYCQVCKKQQGR